MRTLTGRRSLCALLAVLEEPLPRLGEVADLVPVCEVETADAFSTPGDAERRVVALGDFSLLERLPESAETAWLDAPLAAVLFDCVASAFTAEAEPGRRTVTDPMREGAERVSAPMPPTDLEPPTTPERVLCFRAAMMLAKDCTDFLCSGVTGMRRRMAAGDTGVGPLLCRWRPRRPLPTLERETDHAPAERVTMGRIGTCQCAGMHTKHTNFAHVVAAAKI